MCGACGGAGPDWSLPYVSGLRRRASIAGFLTAICRGAAVGTMRQGWTVRTPTGGWSVPRTLTGLIDAVAPRSGCSSWFELQAVIRQRSRGSADAGEGRGRLPLGPSEDGARLAALDATAEVVLPEGDLHLRIAAFLLGVRRFERGAVALEVCTGGAGTASSFRLIGLDGQLIGMAGVAGMSGGATTVARAASAP